MCDAGERAGCPMEITLSLPLVPFALSLALSTLPSSCAYSPLRPYGILVHGARGLPSKQRGRGKEERTEEQASDLNGAVSLLEIGSSGQIPLCPHSPALVTSRPAPRQDRQTRKHLLCIGQQIFPSLSLPLPYLRSLVVDHPLPLPSIR